MCKEVELKSGKVEEKYQKKNSASVTKRKKAQQSVVGKVKDK